MGADVEPPMSEHLAIRRIRPAYEEVADQLRDLVVSGKVGPGDRLPVEGLLSAEFGVNRSTVREAIRLLSSQSLVHTRRGPTGGTFVSEADPEAIRQYLRTSIGLLSGRSGISVTDMSEVREALEVPAARLAARRRTEQQLIAMRETIDREREQNGRGKRFEQSQLFHAQIVEAAANKLLTVIADPIYTVISARFFTEGSRSSYARVNDEHVGILECIERGDADGAGERMAAHMTGLRSVYRDTDPARTEAAGDAAATD